MVRYLSVAVVVAASYCNEIVDAFLTEGIGGHIVACTATGGAQIGGHRNIAFANHPSALAQTEDNDGGDDSASSVTIGPTSSLAIPEGSCLSFAKALFVEGSLSGCIECRDRRRPGTLVRIAEGGEFQGNITCVDTVEVNGKIVGQIECQSAIIGSKAEILGDISAGSVSMEGGATILGIMRCGIAVPAKLAATLPDISENTFATDNPISRLLGGFSHRSNVNKKDSDVIITGSNDGDQIEPRGFDDSNLRLISESAKSLPTSSSEEQLHTNRVADDLTPLYPDDDDDSLLSIQNPSEYVLDISEPIDSELHDEHMLSGSADDETPVQETSGLSKDVKDATPDHFVDAFGRPLIRGATDDEIETLRRNRELVGETREYIDNFAKEKLKKTSHQHHSSGTEKFKRPSNSGRQRNDDESDDEYYPTFLQDNSS